MEYRNILAILVIVYYAPVLFASAALCWRHGFWPSWETWFVLAVFSASRIAYGSLQASTIAQPENASLRIAAATFAVDGVSALMFCSLGLLHRLVDNCSARRVAIHVSLHHLRICEVMITAASICASIGLSELTAEDVANGIEEHPSTARAAVILDIIVLAAIIIGTIDIGRSFRRMGPVEKRVVGVLATSQPFLAIRIVYLALDILGSIEIFSAISGSETALLLLALIEEAIVSAGFLWLGFATPVVDQRESRRDAQRLDSDEEAQLHTDLR